MRFPVLASCVLVIASALAAGAALGDERILAYQSDITVNVDGSMSVAEQIRVRAEGANIRRGIYRDFPTDYKDRFGNRYRVDFEVVSVTRDGMPEAWKAEKHANGVRVYAGRSDLYLDPGVYEYAITYRTHRQLGFFEDHDELYWNVTGNGWAFPIDVARAVVTLPDGVSGEGVAAAAYTGVVGSTARNAVSEVTRGRVVIETVGPMRPQEGLTIVVSWPKGHVSEPGRWQTLKWLLRDNRGLLIALAGFGLIIAYLYVAWLRYGRDPEPGVVFPHYEPPQGFSPGSARFIRKMGYDDRTFTAAVVNLAVNGHLQISERHGDYTLLKKSGDPATLAAGERVLLKQLFSKGAVIELDDANHKVIGGARKAHRRALRLDYEKVYFYTNSVLLVPAAAVAVLTAGLVVLTRGLSPAAIVVLALTAAGLILFHFLLKAATPKGRQLIDRLDGFRLYLDVAERDDLNLKNPPDRTPDLFERYLPFALALGVEQSWAEQFAAVFTRLGRDGQGYSPAWYRGDFSTDRVGNFASSVGSSLTSAIASSATPPGSSSGGGGGFSGGGGGGGGGGGW
jgi:uncharacterized membrane protein YgcG